MAWKENITLDEAIEFLNSLVQVDREAIEALAASRVTCNQELADHPTVQVGMDGDKFIVGLIGILNGMFGINHTGRGPISFIYNSESGELIKVQKSEQTRPITQEDPTFSLPRKFPRKD